MNDLISRQAAIERVLAGKLSDDSLVECVEECNSMLEWAADVLKNMPSAEPGRLTDDDFETIRIHLNAYKEQLCNQHRWEEAEEYQRIIDRFMAFASAQPEIIHCNSCKHWTQSTGKMKGYGLGRCDFHDVDLVTCNGFCYWAERRNDE